MKKGKLGKIIITFIVLIPIFIGLFISAKYLFNAEDTKKDNKKDENKKTYEYKELSNIKEERCDNGYCIYDYIIFRDEDGKKHMKFTLKNNNANKMENACVKLVFSEELSFVSCYGLVDVSATVDNDIILNSDVYSKYSDYKVVNLTGEELEINLKKYLDSKTKDE